jgi:transcriptional regulator with XRE-family HTH domain
MIFYTIVKWSISTIILLFFYRGRAIKTVMDVRRLLAVNIKAERRTLGLSQEKLAELAGLSTQTISDIEGCRTWVSDKTLLKLSEVLKVDIFQLLLPPDEDEAHTKRSLAQRVRKLRQVMKADIDARLDKFFYRKNQENPT